VALADPDLGHPLGVTLHSRSGAVQSQRVQLPVQFRGEEHDGVAPPRLHSQLQLGEAGLSPCAHVVQVNQHRGDALPAVLCEPPAVLRIQVKGIKVLQILLACIVSPYLGELHVMYAATCQFGDLCNYGGEVLSGKVAG